MSLWTRAICPGGCGFIMMHCKCKPVYCECQYGGSPSAHHDNCNSCHKKIKTIYEKYSEALTEIERLKDIIALLEPAPEVTTWASTEINLEGAVLTPEIIEDAAANAIKKSGKP